MNRRPLVLILTAAAVAVWAFTMNRKGDDSLIVEPTQRNEARTASAGNSRTNPQDTAFVPPNRTTLATQKNPGAFATRQWIAPPAPPAPPASAAIAKPVATPPVAPQAPQLPYKFVGFIEPKPGVKPSIFLSLGDKLLVASEGDTLEGGYRLESISANELVFFSSQWNNTTKLSIEGGRS